jgi:hypothetical protein
MKLYLILVLGLLAVGCCGLSSIGDTISDSTVFDDEASQYLKIERNCYWDETNVVCEGTVTNLATDKYFENFNLHLTLLKPKGVTSDCIISTDEFEIGTLPSGEARAFTLQADAGTKQNVRAVIHGGGLIADCTYP